MGFIRERKLKNGAVRYQAEIRLKGHKPLSATFDRKTDAKIWIGKLESDIRSGRHQVFAEAKRRTFKDAVERYYNEYEVSIAKNGQLLWWKKELGHLYLCDIRSSIISEKKQKLLTQKNSKGKIRSKATCNRYLATVSHLLSACWKQWEWIEENPVRKISREKEPQGRTHIPQP